MASYFAVLNVLSFRLYFMYSYIFTDLLYFLLKSLLFSNSPIYTLPFLRKSLYLWSMVEYPRFAILATSFNVKGVPL